MTHAFYKLWMKISAVVILGGAPLLSLGAIPEFSEPARWAVDLLSWPLDGSATFSGGDTRLLSAILGGVLMGWGVLIWALSVWVYDSAPEGVRKCVLTSLICWFVLDSAGSIASGNASNALFNLLFFLVAVGPLWRPVRQDAVAQSGS